MGEHDNSDDIQNSFGNGLHEFNHDKNICIYIKRKLYILEYFVHVIFRISFQIIFHVKFPTDHKRVITTTINCNSKYKCSFLFQNKLAQVSSATQKASQGEVCGANA